MMSVIMESVRPSPSDCREEGNGRKDCSTLSAWLARCKRRKLERASYTGKLNCVPNRLGGEGSATTGGEEAPRKVTTIDSGKSPCLTDEARNRGTNGSHRMRGGSIPGPIVPTDTGQRDA